MGTVVSEDGTTTTTVTEPEQITTTVFNEDGTTTTVVSKDGTTTTTVSGPKGSTTTTVSVTDGTTTTTVSGPKGSTTTTVSDLDGITTTVVDEYDSTTSMSLITTTVYDSTGTKEALCPCEDVPPCPIRPRNIIYDEDRNLEIILPDDFDFDLYEGSIIYIIPGEVVIGDPDDVFYDDLKYAPINVISEDQFILQNPQSFSLADVVAHGLDREVEAFGMVEKQSSSNFEWEGISNIHQPLNVAGEEGNS